MVLAGDGSGGLRGINGGLMSSHYYCNCCGSTSVCPELRCCCDCQFPVGPPLPQGLGSAGYPAFLYGSDTQIVNFRTVWHREGVLAWDMVQRDLSTHWIDWQLCPDSASGLWYPYSRCCFNVPLCATSYEEDGVTVRQRTTPTPTMCYSQRSFPAVGGVAFDDPGCPDWEGDRVDACGWRAEVAGVFFWGVPDTLGKCGGEHHREWCVVSSTTGLRFDIVTDFTLCGAINCDGSENDDATQGCESGQAMSDCEPVDPGMDVDDFDFDR